MDNVEISFSNNDDEPTLWKYDGLLDYLIKEANKINQNEVYWLSLDDTQQANKTDKVWDFEYYLKEDSSLGKKGEGLHVSLGVIEEGKRVSESFVNLIPTLNGGTHERGLKNGLFEGLKSFMNHYSLLPPKVTIESEDLWQKCSYVLSAKILDPQFQGQTKEKLSSESAAKLIQGLIKDNFELWLNENIDFGKKLSEFVISNAQKGLSLKLR